MNRLSRWTCRHPGRSGVTSPHPQAQPAPRGVVLTPHSSVKSRDGLAGLSVPARSRACPLHLEVSHSVSGSLMSNGGRGDDGRDHARHSKAASLHDGHRGRRPFGPLRRGGKDAAAHPLPPRGAWLGSAGLHSGRRGGCILGRYPGPLRQRASAPYRYPECAATLSDGELDCATLTIINHALPHIRYERTVEQPYGETLEHSIGGPEPCGLRIIRAEQVYRACRDLARTLGHCRDAGQVTSAASPSKGDLAQAGEGGQA